VSYAAEPYAQFVDDLLTALTGGATRQRFVFLPEEEPFRLSAPGAVIPGTVRVHGQAAGVFFRFRPNIDFQLAGGPSIEWKAANGGPAADAVWPDEGTAFFANFEYRAPAGAVLPLTDRNPGSVTRLLAESFAREYAVLSRQLEAVYRAGFVETAEGRDLDQVVRLVGVERRRRDVAVGSAVFSRSTPAPADIFIPAGTRLSTAEPPIADFETVEDHTLRRGELSAEAPIASLLAGAPGVVAAGTVRVIHRPILGVESVSNPQATRFGGAEETDEALRARASLALQGAGGATTGALLAALTSLPGVREKDVRIAEDHIAHPGLVRLTVALPKIDDAELRDELAAEAVERIAGARPAGVRIVHNLDMAVPAGAGSPGPGVGAEDGTFFGVASPGVEELPVRIAVRLTPTTLTLTPDERLALESAARATVEAFFAEVGLGEVLIYNRLVAALMQIPAVLDVALDWMYLPSQPPQGGAQSVAHRQNLFPLSPNVRPVLDPGDLDIEVGGQLVVLYVRANVTLKGLGLLGNQDDNREEAFRQVAERLRAGVRTFSQLELTPQALQSLLGGSATWDATLHYEADFIEAGVRIHKRDVTLKLTGLESLWIARVTPPEEEGT
jgi:uncharacterized phage protein gp47/JayE